MPYIFQIQKTAAEFVLENPTLAENYEGLETDTNLIKFGDGARAWDTLNYTAPTIAGSRTKWPTTVSVDRAGEPWLNPTNVLSRDPNRLASVTRTGTPDRNSERLFVSGFDMNIPSDADLVGLELRIRWYAVGATAATDGGVQIWFDSAEQSEASQAISLPSEPTVTVYGSPTDIWGGLLDLSPAETLNRPDFSIGIFIGLDVTGSSTITAYIDYITVTAYWDAP